MKSTTTSAFKVTPFGQLQDEREAIIYTISNQNGMTVVVSDQGETYEHRMLYRFSAE